jgi:hypothetical protein
MFSQPITSVTEALAEACQVDHVGEGRARITAFSDRHEIQDGEWKHPVTSPRQSFE